MKQIVSIKKAARDMNMSENKVISTMKKMFPDARVNKASGVIMYTMPDGLIKARNEMYMSVLTGEAYNQEWVDFSTGEVLNDEEKRIAIEEYRDMLLNRKR